MGFILPCDVMGLTDQTYVRHLFYRMLSGDQRVVNCFGLWLYILKRRIGPTFLGENFISPGLRTKQLGLNLGWWSSAHLISLRSKLGLHEINVEKTLCSSGQSWLMGFYLLDLWIVHANLRTCVCLVWSCSFHLNMLQRVHLVEVAESVWLSFFLGVRQVVESDDITDDKWHENAKLRHLFCDEGNI